MTPTSPPPGPPEGPLPTEVIAFWFDERVRALWFASTPAFDQQVRERFESTWRAARDGRLKAWGATAEGALALVLVLDQFPLNIYRGRPEAFATEARARAVADRAIALGFDRLLDDEQRGFLYLPFMHSESPADQDRSVSLYEAAGFAEGLRWARHHRDIVRRFGRFPHRNAILGRESTSEEHTWLASEEGFRG